MIELTDGRPQVRQFERDLVAVVVSPANMPIPAIVSTRMNSAETIVPWSSFQNRDSVAHGFSEEFAPTLRSRTRSKRTACRPDPRLAFKPAHAAPVGSIRLLRHSQPKPTGSLSGNREGTGRRRSAVGETAARQTAITHGIKVFPMEARSKLPLPGWPHACCPIAIRQGVFPRTKRIPAGQTPLHVAQSPQVSFPSETLRPLQSAYSFGNAQPSSNSVLGSAVFARRLATSISTEPGNHMATRIQRCVSEWKRGAHCLSAVPDQSRAAACHAKGVRSASTGQQLPQAVARLLHDLRRHLVGVVASGSQTSGLPCFSHRCRTSPYAWRDHRIATTPALFPAATTCVSKSATD